MCKRLDVCCKEHGEPKEGLRLFQSRGVTSTEEMTPEWFSQVEDTTEEMTPEWISLVEDTCVHGCGGCVRHMSGGHAGYMRGVV